ncbi:MAG: DNA polymerase domain-containing protein, partial [Nitrososphaeraceae archaeon]
WILVTSFGYLGFSNAKFGRIDAHIAVCAFARNILSQTMHIAEDMNFDVLHGIVDSIWVKKRDGATNNDYTNLKETIKKETGFDISFEGVYKWIAFLPSVINSHLPVLNRYFGVFEDGTIKTRGIEGRRHDTPDFLVQCQNEILEILAQGTSISDIKQNKLSLIIKKIKDNLSLLKYRKVDPERLIFTKLLSKDYNQYHNRNTLENSAIKQLELNGEYLKAGQVLQYVIIDYNGPLLKRVLPIQLLDDKTNYYDIKRYSELLIDICNNIIKPFGIVFDQNQSGCRLDNY